MAFFGKVVEFHSGGIGEKIVDTVKDYFPPKLSESERMKLEEVIRKAAREHELQLLSLAQQEQQQFDDRIREMEGTAKDLQQFGKLGELVVFLRLNPMPRVKQKQNNKMHGKGLAYEFYH